MNWKCEENAAGRHVYGGRARKTKTKTKAKAKAKAKAKIEDDEPEGLRPFAEIARAKGNRSRPKVAGQIYFGPCG